MPKPSTVTYLTLTETMKWVTQEGEQDKDILVGVIEIGQGEDTLLELTRNNQEKDTPRFSWFNNEERYPPEPTGISQAKDTLLHLIGSVMKVDTLSKPPELEKPTGIFLPGKEGISSPFLQSKRT